MTFTPNGDGGDPITSFRAQCASTDGGRSRSQAGTASPITVTRLTPGKNYHCRARAYNSVAGSRYSPYGGTVTLDPSSPARPRVVNTTTPVGGTMRVAFVAGWDNGSPDHGFHRPVRQHRRWCRQEPERE